MGGFGRIFGATDDASFYRHDRLAEASYIIYESPFVILPL